MLLQCSPATANSFKFRVDPGKIATSCQSVPAIVVSQAINVIRLCLNSHTTLIIWSCNSIHSKILNRDAVEIKLVNNHKHRYTDMTSLLVSNILTPHSNTYNPHNHMHIKGMLHTYVIMSIESTALNYPSHKTPQLRV